MLLNGAQESCNTRAWTCQEYLLSQRLIFVTEVETFLVVGNTLISERFTDRKVSSSTQTLEAVGLQAKTLTRKLTAHEALIHPDSPLWSHYGDALVTYTKRNLTHPVDRLAAFLGILNRFYDSSGDESVMSGLPSK